MPIRTAHIVDIVDRSGAQTRLMMPVRGLAHHHLQHRTL
jgi:hypothetical protein